MMNPRQGAVQADGAARIEVDSGTKQEVADEREYAGPRCQPDATDHQERVTLAGGHPVAFLLFRKVAAESVIDLVQADREQQHTRGANQHQATWPAKDSGSGVSRRATVASAVSGQRADRDRKAHEVRETLADVCVAIEPRRPAAAFGSSAEARL